MRTAHRGRLARNPPRIWSTGPRQARPTPVCHPPGTHPPATHRLDVHLKGAHHTAVRPRAGRRKDHRRKDHRRGVARPAVGHRRVAHRRPIGVLAPRTGNPEPRHRSTVMVHRPEPRGRRGHPDGTGARPSRSRRRLGRRMSPVTAARAVTPLGTPSGPATSYPASTTGPMNRVQHARVHPGRPGHAGVTPNYSRTPLPAPRPTTEPTTRPTRTATAAIKTTDMTGTTPTARRTAPPAGAMYGESRW